MDHKSQIEALDDWKKTALQTIIMSRSRALGAVDTIITTTEEYPVATKMAIIFASGAALHGLGFLSGGILKGSWAALVQSKIHNIPALMNVFSKIQSVTAGKTLLSFWISSTISHIAPLATRPALLLAFDTVRKAVTTTTDAAKTVRDIALVATMVKSAVDNEDVMRMATHAVDCVSQATTDAAQAAYEAAQAAYEAAHSAAQRTVQVGQAAHEHAQYAAHGVSQATKVAAQYAAQATRDAAKAAQSAAHYTTQAAQSAAQYTTQAAQGASHYTALAAQGTSQYAAQAVQGTSHYAAQAAQGTSHYAAQAVQGVAQYTPQAVQEAAHYSAQKVKDAAQAAQHAASASVNATLGASRKAVDTVKRVVVPKQEEKVGAPSA